MLNPDLLIPKSWFFARFDGFCYRLGSSVLEKHLGICHLLTL